MTDLQPILDYGYTPREAGFLARVGIHSGHFVTAQFCRFAGVDRDHRCANFLSKALGKGHIRDYEYRQRGPAHNRRRYHLHSRAFYERLGIPNSNNRRDQSLAIINTRIAALDFVIDHPELEYFATEREKVNFFQSIGLPIEVLPTKSFFSADGGRRTTAHFVDKFPLAVDSDSGKIVFTYVHDQSVPTAFFEAHVRQYLPLWQALDRPWSLVHVSDMPHARTLAEGVFNGLFNGGRALDEELLRYFRLQHAYETEDWDALSRQDLLDRAALARTYKTVHHRQLFERWRQGDLAGEPAVQRRTTIEFSIYAPPTTDRLSVMAS